MAKVLFTCCFWLSALLPLVQTDSQTSNASPALSSSSCSNAHGWMRISIERVVGNLSCFSPEINGKYASIGGGGVNANDGISIQMMFLARAGTHTCKTPMVVIELREKAEMWSAYRVRNGQFGHCTITQSYEDGHRVWKGHALATLVIVKGDTESGSPRHLHSEKDAFGNPLTRRLEVEWVFDRLFRPDQHSAGPSTENH